MDAGAASGLETLANVAAFLGILVLSVPVWHMNSNRKKLQRIRDADTSDVADGSFRQKVRTIAEEKAQGRVATWRWWHEGCLWLGYGLLLGGSAIRLI